MTMAPQIEIVAPRSDWAFEFQALKASIREVLPAAIAIHHIGSTAVSGLAAKDVIDIQATVASLDVIDPERLGAAGFTEVPGLVDHAPAGLDIARVELAKRFFKGNRRNANLHIREQGRFNQRYALLCRDYLRSHPVSAAAYGLIKQRLAARFPDDEDAYYDIKDPLFDIIVEGAGEWSARIGWQEPPGD